MRLPGFAATSPTVPCAITCPPSAPATGPISIRWSARLEHAHVMVHDHHGIAVRHQVVHHAEQPIHVRGMQADGRLVEHIQHAGGAVAHGTGELHTLAFAG